MDHQHVDNELSHLERMLPHFADGPFPIAYWTGRIESLETLRGNSQPPSSPRPVEKKGTRNCSDFHRRVSSAGI